MLSTVRGCDAGGSRVRRTRREALPLRAGIGIVLWCDTLVCLWAMVVSRVRVIVKSAFPTAECAVRQYA